MFVVPSNFNLTFVLPNQLLLLKAPFRRLVCEIIHRMADEDDRFRDIRIQSLAECAMQEAAEAYLIYILGEANLCAIHAKRVTIMPNEHSRIYGIRINGGGGTRPGCRVETS